MLVQQKQNIKGFTLLEILVVVAIVGIISAVSYPRLETWISKNRVIGEAEKIHSLISLVTSQVERGYYPYAMIQFEIGSPTVIKAQGVTQTTFNKKIKKLAMQKKTVACEKTDFTGWSGGGANDEWQEIGTHTMHKDTFLDKLTQTSQTKEKTICFSKGGKYFKEPSGLHWVIFDKNSNRKSANYITICHVNSEFCDTENKKFDDNEKKYDAYLVKYSRFGLVEKYRWDYIKNDFIKY